MGHLSRSASSITASRRGWVVAAAMLWLVGFGAMRAAAATAGYVALPGSIRAVSPTPPANPAAAAYIAHAHLSIVQLSLPMEFNLSLKMRNFAELQSRVNRGEIISAEEMADKYWPLPADYEAAADWLTQRGFAIDTTNPSRIMITATGLVAQVQGIFQTDFARVASDGLEFSSAITAPSVPESLAPVLVGVNGLQPHLRKHPSLIKPADAAGFSPPFYPNQIKKAYGADTLAYDGTGQTIAIVMSAFPSGNVSTSANLTNLTKFWTATNITRTGTYAAIAVGSGPTARAGDIATEEVCLDVEWSSSIAPGANIRVYGTSSLAFTPLDQAYQKIYTDASTHPEFGLHVVSLSYGGSESSASQLTTDDQFFVQLSSLGITVFASSGDNGSSSGAESPASDPNVTGVGGTSITMNTTSGVVTAETAWSGSGGNVSAFFAKPSWQTGTGISGSIAYRQVPDVSAPADPGTGAFIVYNNTNTTVGGTSWSAPTWAGFAALINQARAIAHEQPLGLLNPKVYPLLGTSSFRDITSGNNGGFNAGVGYDMITGLGVPVFPDLLNQLVQALVPPANVTVNAGQDAVISFIAASSIGTFQWQRQPANSSSWLNVAEGDTYQGVATGILTIVNAAAVMSGDQFRCVAGNITTPAATLVVIGQPYYTTTLAGQPSTPGTSDGQGSAAMFSYPNDVALDANGNIFVADTNNGAVRKVTPDGNVTTFAGSPGVPGYVNAIGTNARFNFDNALDFDSGGNIFVADSTNNAIRKITPDGNVTTFAGSVNGSAGTQNAAGTNARFNFPAGICVAPNGTIIVADSNNDLIRKITPAGNVTTLAGNATFGDGFADGNGTAARFSFPAAVVADSGGNVFVADANNNVIRKITPGGNVTTFAGAAFQQGIADGTGAFARFNYPSGIAIDNANNLYVTDTYNNSIRKITPARVVTTLSGQVGPQGSADGVGAFAQFSQPFGAVVNNATGVIYVADLLNHEIRQMQPAAAPQFQTQSGNLAVNVGDPADFTITATGVPTPAYQWQLRANGSSTWANLVDDEIYSGTASAHLALNATTADMDRNQFRCVLVNPLQTTFSASMMLRFYAAPTLLSQSGNVTVVAGNPTQFTITVDGVPAPSFQWQRLPAGGDTWMPLANDVVYNGTATASLSLNTTASVMDGDQFRCLVSNSLGNLTSAPALLTVYAPPVFTSLPGDQGVNNGDPAVFAAIATANPSAITYQWQMRASADVAWGNLADGGIYSGANTTTLTLNATNTALSGAQFRVVAGNGINPDTVSTTANLTVYPSGYQIWAASLNLSGASAQLSASPFGDAIPNLARFAMNLGANPSSADLPALSTQTVDGTSYLTLDYSVNKALVGEQVVAQYSYDLQTWQPVAPGFTVQVTDPNAHTSRYQVQVAVPAHGTVFLRLIVQPAP